MLPIKMLPIKKSVVKKFDDNNFIYFGIHLSAYTDSKGKIQKKSILPVGWNDINAKIIKPIYDKESQKNIDPNGFSIITEKSNISVIDVDKPEECTILNKLIDDCKWIHKTRKGYHFIFQNNDLPRRNSVILLMSIQT